MRTFLEIAIGGTPVGRMVFQLYADETPRTCENFRALCTGECGVSKASGKPLTLKGSSFHRVIKGFMAQGGDFTNHDGTGGESVYGGKFRDENFKRKFGGRGTLAMANAGPHTNGSQFFVTFKRTSHLNGKHVVFGRLVSGFEVLTAIGRVRTGTHDRPKRDVVIVDCGEEADPVAAPSASGENESKISSTPEVKKATSDDVPQQKDPEKERAAFLQEAVVKRAEAERQKRSRDAAIVEKKTQGLSFPVPTMTNPSAVYIDEAARSAAQEKLDAKNGTRRSGGAVQEVPLDPRKRRLLEIRKKMAEGQALNRKEVMAEHERRQDPSFEKRKKRMQSEKAYESKISDLAAAGIPESKMHLVETAAAASRKYSKKRKKEQRADGVGDAQLKAYKKRIAKLPKASSGGGRVQLSVNEMAYGADNKVDPKAVERLVSELKEKKAANEKWSRRRQKYEGDDITSINQRNERFNKKLSRELGEYTAEIRQNLERGTAL